jgi:Eukaryotic rRNA processing protein EBP2
MAGSDDEGKMEHSASSDDWEGEGASSDEGDVPGGAARRHIYNAEALHEKLEDIAWVEEQPWEEGLVVTAAAPTRVDDVDDDLQRELAFYNQVWAAAGLHSLRAQHLCVHPPPHTHHFNFATYCTYIRTRLSTAWSSTCAHSSRP